MNELLQVQEAFQHFILTGNSSISNSIVSGTNVPVETRLGIYRDAYQSRLIESLMTTFPALHAYLGTKAFRQLCLAYIDAHPSSFRSIRWYGGTLSEFMKHYYEKPYAYLAELADFEWRMTLAFDAADDTMLHIDEMAAVPPESWAGLQFTVHPSVSRFNGHWNSVSVWHALVHDVAIPEWRMSPKALPWILWRSPQYIIQFYSLSEEEAWALDALMQGLSFGELCEGLCQWVNAEEVGMKAASFLKHWIQSGMLSHVQAFD